MTPSERLDELRLIGRGILSEAMDRPPEPTHGGDNRARLLAIGEKTSAIQKTWERLHAEYAEFMREQVKAATTPKEKKGS